MKNVTPYLISALQYFLEPLTGMKFHSVPEVRNYLADEIVKLENFDSSNPPEKVEWRLACGLGEDNWSPFVEDSRIPDHVKELWQDSFFLGMTGSERQIPQVIFRTFNKYVFMFLFHTDLA